MSRFYRIGTPVPGLPQDGEPLTFGELRALSDIDMASMISVPEPVYGRRAS